MGLIEVKILEFTLVLLVDIASTVADITSLAVNEYLLFNKKKTPQKILYTIDDKGRILSGTLKIIEHGLSSSQLEVIVQDYTTSDFLYSNQVESLYREWQVWTVNQLKEYIQQLAYQEIPSYPDEQTLHLLYELGGSRHERVQSMCVKALQLLMTKFNQKKIVIESADQLSILFSSTKYADVAISVLDSFKGLSSLQARVFNSSAYIKNMFNIQLALTRFTTEKQSLLFEAFASVSAVLGDQELINVITSTASAAYRTAEQQASIIDDTTITTNSSAVEALPPSTRSITSDPSRRSLGISFKRLEVLLASDDQKVRLFALEKLNKLLKESRKAQVVKKDPSRVQQASNEDVMVEGKKDFISEISGQIMHDEVGKVAVKSIVDSDDQHPAVVISRRDVESLLLCLLTCLKRSIKGREVANGQRQRSKRGSSIVTAVNGRGGGGGGSGMTNDERNTSGGEGNKQPTSSSSKELPSSSSSSSSASSATTLSIAGRLIELAFEHSETDHAAIQLSMDCIWYIIHYKNSNSNNSGLDGDVVGDDPTTVKLDSIQKFKVTGEPLTTNQMIFVTVAMPWQKLLLTLTHCTESNQYNSHHYHDLAEKCAYCFLLLLLLNNTSSTGIPKVDSQVIWSGFNVESPAINSFLITSKPSFRLYLALSYLKYLSSNITATSTNNILTSKKHSHHNYHHNHHHNQQKHSHHHQLTSDEELSKLKELLTYNNYAITRWLWQWAIQSSSIDGSRRKSAVMALDCLSSSCVFSEVHEYLIELDPINRLCAMLQKAVRHRDKEKIEFSVRRLFTDNDVDDDYEGSRSWYCGIVNGMNAATEGDDDVIDEREIKLSIYEDEPMLSKSSSASILSKDDGDDDDDDQSNDDHQRRVVPVTYESSYIYPDLLLIRGVLKMIWNLLVVKDDVSFHEGYRRKIASWIVTVEVGALSINIVPLVAVVVDDDDAMVNRMGVRKGRIDNRRDDDDMSDVHSHTGSSIISHNHIYMNKGDINSNHYSDQNSNRDQQHHKGIKLSRIALEDPVIMLYYNLLSSTSTSPDDGI